MTYFPSRSVSRLTRWPTRLLPSVVCRCVCGMMATPKAMSFRLAIVRLIPSTAMDPFSTSRRRRASGYENENHHIPPVSRTSMMVPTPSIWPVTKCPPSRSVGRQGRSRFTASAMRSFPRVVRPMVSSDRSTSNASCSTAVTVRQVPSTAMLSPIARPTMVLLPLIVSLATPPSRRLLVAIPEPDPLPRLVR